MSKQKNAYVWYSPRGFANEGIIYVCQDDKVNELMDAIEQQKNYNEVNSRITRITRKQAEKDKDFLAYGNYNWQEENSVQSRIDLAYEATKEQFEF